VRHLKVPRLLVAVTVAIAAGVSLGAQRQAHTPLFKPEDLGILESPDRDEWQQADRIMDALSIGEASKVADVGAGSGWFTIRLAQRVGPNGRVYAEDVQALMIESTKRRVANQGFSDRVVFVLGTSEDPQLPKSLDAILVVDTYPAFERPVDTLRRLGASLAPNGRLGIVDFRKDGVGGPGPPFEERVDQADVKRDAAAAGLRLIREETFLRYQYLLLFGRP
jgi:ubiquinone/menaquinone biosynthesis C-methylase UbiE